MYFMAITERISKYLDIKGVTKYKFCKDLAFSNGFLDKPREITTDKYANILEYFPELNPEWLLTGNGEMLKESSRIVNHYSKQDEAFAGGSPFYEDLPVSAGSLEHIESTEEKPSGYIKIPGVSASSFFPVIGYSMKPEIYPGDIIGVSRTERWEKVDPDKVYMIITHEERMIKHLRIDNERDDILWCISPNYKEFFISKNDIKIIYQVVFVGRLI